MISARRRAVVTGLGVVSPTGIGVDRFWESLVRGEVGTGPARVFDTSALSSDRVGEVKGFDPRPAFRVANPAQWARGVQMMVAAGREAAESAGLGLDDFRALGARCACVLGTGVGVRAELESRFRRWWHDGKPSGGWDPSRIDLPAMAEVAATELGIGGEVLVLSTACAAANDAVGYAKALIELDEADVALVGGADTLSQVLGSLFSVFLALSPDVVRPFDAGRKGLILSEGAGALILEASEHARARGARRFGAVLGYGARSDAHDMMDPHPQGLGAVMAMAAAVDDAGVRRADVDYVSAHGTGTSANDRIEAAAIHEVFGSRAEGLPVSSIKSMLGHLQGAAGALESIACLLAMRDGVVPPTIHFEEPDPECRLDVVPNRARKQVVSFPMNNAFGFGGACSVLVFGGE